MNGRFLFSLIAVIVLFLLAFMGVQVVGLQYLFGVVVPYTALTVFIGGFIYRVLGWARSPVPFRIPSTCGQQKSLPWIKHAKLDNPYTSRGVVGRMILEIVCFRSLFRNTKCRVGTTGRIAYIWEKWLWLGAIVFHYSLAVVLVRHLRFFMEPVPSWLNLVENVDGFLQIGTPVLSISGIILLVAATYLILRRVFIPQVNYISLVSDYFPLFLIFGIVLSGIMMRYFFRIDVVGAKELAMGLVTLHPVVPAGIGAIFYAHVFLGSILLAYFPFSKLMHLGGIFMSPTRNLPGNSRAVRHVNPWNYPVAIHTYEEYEDEFREKMIEAGLPVEKE